MTSNYSTVIDPVEYQERAEFEFDLDETLDKAAPQYVRCPVCKGSGIDPACSKSHQDDEYDCVYCAGYGDVEAF